MDEQEQTIVQLLAEESDRLADSVHLPPSHSGLCAWEQDEWFSESEKNPGMEEDEAMSPVEVKSQPDVEDSKDWEDSVRRSSCVDPRRPPKSKPMSSSAAQLKPDSHKRLLESVVSAGTMDLSTGKPQPLRLFKSNALSEKAKLQPRKPGRTFLEPGKIRRRSDISDDSPQYVGSRSPLPHLNERFW